MTGTTWIIDSQRFATKIKNASGSSDPTKQKWVSNPSKECPKCSHVIDNSDVVHQWPGLPKGVKFDPTDQELLWHLLSKHGKAGVRPHPFIDEFIPTVEEDDGICYTHPQKLPGVKKNGSVSHFFHRTFKAYNTGTRKRRKINTDDLADVRWHKTGKTKPVLLDGKHLGCKKIMVLYMGAVKGGKPEKTNWVMHQYHIGTGEDEKDGEYVVSKIFFQQQLKPGDKTGQELTTMDCMESTTVDGEHPDFPSLSSEELVTTDQEVIQNPEHNPYQQLKPGDKNGQELISMDCMESTTVDGDHSDFPLLSSEKLVATDQEVIQNPEHNRYQVNVKCDISADENATGVTVVVMPSEKPEDSDNPQSQDLKLWEGDSQFELLNSQQLAEGLAICDEFLLSQSLSQTSCCGEDDPRPKKPLLSVYAQLPAEDFKKDLEECQRLDPSENKNLAVCAELPAEAFKEDLEECQRLEPSGNTNPDLDNTTEFRLSQIEFSEDSFTTWAAGMLTDE